MIQKDSFGLRSRDRPLQYSFQQDTDYLSIQQQIKSLRKSIQPLLELKDLMIIALRNLKHHDQMTSLLQTCSLSVQTLRSQMLNKFNDVQNKLQNISDTKNKQNQRSGNKPIPTRGRVPSSDCLKHLLVQNKSSKLVGDIDLSTVLVKTSRLDKKDLTRNLSNIEDRKRMLQLDLQKKLKQQNDRRKQMLGPGRISQSRLSKQYSTRQQKKAQRSGIL